MKLSLSLCSITASIFLAALLSGQDAQAQIKLGGNSIATRGDALLELESPRKGLLLPRVTSMALTAPPLDTAARGMIVYNVTDNKIYIRSNSTWKAVGEEASTGWGLTGNSSINPATNFLGTTDAQPIIFRTNNTEAARIAADRKMGIGTTLPNSHLHVNGSTATNVAVATGNFTMADSNSVVIMNNTGNANFALQNPANYKGRAIEIVAYNTGAITFTGYNIRTQNGVNPTVGLPAGYSLRLVSNGTDWVITSKQRSGLPLYMATTNGTGEGEVVRDLNGFISRGSGVYQTDVGGNPANQIPNETAWFSMTLQSVGGGYFGQFNLNDHNAYFRGNSITNLPVAEWYKMISHPATVEFAGESLGTDSLRLNMINNRSIVFATNNVNRFRLNGNGNISMHGPVLIDGTLSANGAATLQSTLNTAGATTLQSTLLVQNSATFERNAVVEDSLRVEGRMRMQGMVIANIRNVNNGNATLADNDYALYITSNGDQTLTLTTGAAQIGRIVVARTRKNGSGTDRTLTITASGGNVEGGANITIPIQNSSNNCVTLQQLTATNWIVIAR